MIRQIKKSKGLIANSGILNGNERSLMPKPNASEPIVRKYNLIIQS